MAIPFTCPHCGHRTAASEAYAGSSGPCAHCGAIVKLPGAKAELASPGKYLVHSGVVRSRGKGLNVLSVVVLAVVVAACGYLLFPAISTPREASRRSHCSNNLKQIGLALHGYHDQYRVFPPAFITDENGRPMHSWRVLILPYMEYGELYKEYNFDEPWDGPKNRQLMEQCPPIFHCPSDEGDKNSTRYRVVVGPGTGWKANASITIRDIADGTSNSVAVLETLRPGRNWLDPAPLTLDEALSPPQEQTDWTSGPRFPHLNGRQAVFFDGSTHFLPADLDAEKLGRLLLINDGEEIPRDLF
ncbi:DUF1559 family PulG-like putative transporter [Lignipirellula cremea]|uniref:DUF1559 domain-containing protein n=1 Tax=Lignipirellula cremea TaxID=2528010 RepID=A0A518DU12_9BACT|nr:DUF1559 domain-containing protein [Lignipirellula cremea]QDU95332.1 hypothetical protein Pla8534_31470 [Lignipirellula cremea]